MERPVTPTSAAAQRPPPTPTSAAIQRPPVTPTSATAQRPPGSPASTSPPVSPRPHRISRSGSRSSISSQGTQLLDSNGRKFSYTHLVKALTFSIKVTVSLDPPLKTPVIQTVLKDCTVHSFVGMILKKYRAASRKSGDAPEVHAIECALDARVEGLPSPLPMDRNANLKDKLMELVVPYPFCLWLVYDPAYMEQREAERVKRERALKAAQEREERLQRLKEQFRATHHCELQEREQLQRRWLEMVYDASAGVLHILHQDFMEVLALQGFKEHTDRMDAESDRRFFQRLQDPRYSVTARSAESQRMRRRVVRQMQHELLIAAQRQFQRIKAVEARAWARLQWYGAEALERVQLQSALLLDLGAQHLTFGEDQARRAIARVEAERSRALLEDEDRARREIRRSEIAAERSSRRQRHMVRLQGIIQQLDAEVAARGPGASELALAAPSQAPCPAPLGTGPARVRGPSPASAPLFRLPNASHAHAVPSAAPLTRAQRPIRSAPPGRSATRAPPSPGLIKRVLPLWTLGGPHAVVQQVSEAAGRPHPLGPLPLLTS